MEPKVHKNNDRRTELLDVLAKQVEALQTSAGWKEWLSVARRFHTYSFRNQLLILAQKPGATRVAGYRAWQALGRQVQKGERGIAVLAPSVRLTDPDHSDDQPVQTLVGFRVVHVFDISQTTGTPLPTLEMPSVPYAPTQLLRRLKAVTTELGIELRAAADASNGARGWWSPTERAITLVSSFDHASQTRTLLHELSHALDPAEDSAERASDSRACREIVAESSAWLVGTAEGIEMTEASTHYLATWGGTSKSLMALAQRTLTTWGRLAALLSQVGEEAEAA